MKLYQLTTKDMGDYWVVANNPYDAETTLMKAFAEGGYGLSSNRYVINIRLITEQIGDMQPFMFSDQKRLVIQIPN